MDKCYALISEGWTNTDSGITGRCLGVFSSSELAVKAANDYLKKISNNKIYNIEGLCLDWVRIYPCKDKIEDSDHKSWYIEGT